MAKRKGGEWLRAAGTAHVDRERLRGAIPLLGVLHRMGMIRRSSRQCDLGRHWWRRAQGDSALVVFAVLSVAFSACGGRTPPRTSSAAARPNIQLPAGLPAPRAQHSVRDIVTEERLAVEDRGGLLVLRSDAGVIDTLTEAGPHDSVAERSSASVGDAFVRIDSWLTGGPLESDLVLAADGRLVLAAKMSGGVRLPPHVNDTSYRATFTLEPDGPTIRGVESWRHIPTDSSVQRSEWSQPFTLEFDPVHRVFFNRIVPLDSVPLEGTDRAVSGRFPGIVLKSSTRVYVDSAWYSLSLPEDLDPEEFARGTSGVIAEGRGVFKDTLRPVR